MKHLKYLLFLILTPLFTSTAFADEHPVTIEGNITLTSDYVFRGVSQTAESPAVQGGFDISGDLLYAGVWGSNANYSNGTDAGDGASGEFDFYVGLTKDFGSMSLDLGAVHYDYPGQSALNTEDVYVIAGFGSIEVGYYQTTSADWFGTDNGAGTTYTYGAYSLALNESISASFSYGQTAVAGDGNDTADYADTKTALSFPLFGTDIELAYTTTSYDNPAGDLGEIDDSRFIVSISKAL